jgi:anti-sigma regulatory factor (Ser/Thr protein kinase)
MKQSCELEILSNISELHRIQATLEQLAVEWNISPKPLFQINLALEELVTNIINYGYDNNQHTIVLSFVLVENVVTIQVQDKGKEFNPLTLPEPDTGAPAEKRQIGGLGIHLVKTLMDSIAYERKNDTNILTIEKKIK